MSTTTDIHGHDVLHLVHDTPGGFTREALTAEVTRRWGPNARFCTCSAGGMTFDQLLAFLLARGKIVETDGRLQTIMAKVCSHGSHGHDHDHQH